MVKTHQKSRFVLKSLNDIRDSREIVLQFEKTDSVFSGTSTAVYLCEVVAESSFLATASIEELANEIIRVNTENRRLRRKIDQLVKDR